MKKIAKLSLVAAVAVAGMTSASAASLEEAIKGVDVSGMVRYRYIDTKTETGVGNNNVSTEQKNDFDIEVTAKVPVNDMVKAIIKVDSAVDTYGSTTNNSNNTAGDGDLALDIEDAYFQFALPYATVNVGKQNIPGPLTDGNQGTGIVALVPAGPVTVAAGYFNNHNTTGVESKNAAEIAVLGSFGPVNAEAWYADVTDTLDAYSVKVAANVGPVSIDAQHTALELDSANAKDNELTKIELGASFGMVNVNAAYATTSKYNGDTSEGGFANGAVIDDGSDAAAGFGLEVVDITALPDADVFVVGVNANVSEKINVGVEYLTGDTTTHTTGVAAVTTDLEELKFSASYAMSKNFSISSYYTIAEEDVENTVASDKETTEGRVELRYSF